MVLIKDFNAPSNCVDCQNEGLSEIVGCGLFAECGKHPDCPFIEVKEDDCVSRAELKKWLDLNFSFGGALRKLEMFDRIDKELPPVGGME